VQRGNLAKKSGAECRLFAGIQRSQHGRVSSFRFDPLDSKRDTRSNSNQIRATINPIGDTSWLSQPFVSSYLCTIANGGALIAEK
jgi:hypothetical protein